MNWKKTARDRVLVVVVVVVERTTAKTHTVTDD